MPILAIRPAKSFERPDFRLQIAASDAGDEKYPARLFNDTFE